MYTDTMTNKLTKLHEQIAALKVRAKDEKKRVTAKLRKEETRRKILIGAMALKDMEANPDTEMAKRLIRLLNEYTTRPQDRILLGLSQPADDLKAKFSGNDKNSKPEKG